MALNPGGLVTNGVKMQLKRIARASMPLLIAVLVSWPFGFPVGVIGMGAILSFLVYQYWDDAKTHGERVYRTGERVYRAVKAGWTVVTEETPRPASPDPAKSNDPTPNPTEDVVTGHLVEEEEKEPAPTPMESEEETAFVIGTTEDGRVITIDKITSLGVGGVPGSGKTVAVVGLSTQAVVKYKGNIRIVVVDPHMLTGSEDALSARMAPLEPFYLKVGDLPNPVSGGGALLQWIKWLDKQAVDRIGGKVPRDQQQKILIVADEFTALMEDESIADPLSTLLLKINEQARKVGMFALLASPQWKSSRIQGTEVRNTISSFLVHNMPPNIARQLVPDTIAETSGKLRVGQAIFSSFGMIEVVKVPLMTHKKVAECIAPYLPDESNCNPGTPVSGQGGEVAEPTIAEVKSIWETYQILDRELKYDEENIIRALAIDVYGAEDPHGKEKVKRALKLGEEHLL